MAPVWEGSIVRSGIARDVQVVGPYTYVADWYGGLQVVDVRHPLDPQRVGSVGTGGYVEKVHVLGSYAYLADWDSGLVVIDVSDPVLLLIQVPEVPPGDFILSLELEPTLDTLPVITNQPAGVVEVPGQDVLFQVGAKGQGLSCQWYFNDEPIPGATSSEWMVSQATAADVGHFAVQVQNAAGRSVWSLPAALELASESHPVSQNKWEASRADPTGDPSGL